MHISLMDTMHGLVACGARYLCGARLPMKTAGSCT